jgi:lipoprotein-releasing system ATP-binding protein
MSEALQPAAEVLGLVGLCKSYGVGTAVETEVLHGVDLAVASDDFAALIGPSGSGKSTLLNLLGLLDTPSAGELYLLGQPTSAMDDGARTALRGSTIGFVFQFHYLLPAFTVLENVLLPRMLSRGRPRVDDVRRAEALLAEVGLAGVAARSPAQLSGGQQQRVAIARALMTQPKLLLADEPTGNLDTVTAASVFALFRRVSREYGCAVLIVTHDPRLSGTCDRTIELVDGRIVGDTRHPPGAPRAAA